MIPETKRNDFYDPNATVDAVAPDTDATTAKALVLAYARRLAADGHAESRLLENGDVRLRFRSGETFLLADTSITRIA